MDVFATTNQPQKHTQVAAYNIFSIYVTVSQSSAFPLSSFPPFNNDVFHELFWGGWGVGGVVGLLRHGRAATIPPHPRH